jgi:hypothetical protein
MATLLDTRRMRQCTPSQLRDYYKEIHDDATEKSYTRQILAAIERGSVAPSPTFAVWLGVTKSPSLIVLGLDQNFSIIVKTCSVHALGRLFYSSQWEWTWQDFGGAAGMIDDFARMSINDVREVCKLIGKSAKGENVAQKRYYVTQLFECLHPNVFPDFEFHTYDQRPLTKYYRHLIPSCDEALVERIVAGDLKGTWKPISDKLLMQFHPEVMRREQLRALERNSGVDINSTKFLGLATYTSSGRRTAPEVPPSMDFAMDVLRRLVKDPKYQLEDYSAIQLIRSLLRRAIRKRLAWATIGEMTDLTMVYLEAHPSARQEITVDTGDIIQLVAMCWARKPDLFEKQLRKLCSGTDFGISTIHHLTIWAKFLDRIPKRQRYALLRICLLESYGMDLESHTDLKKFKGSLEDSLLDKLEPEEALDLFNRLRAARGNDNLVTVRAANTVQGIASVYNTSAVDIDLYHVSLLNRNGLHAEARTVATKQLELRKHKAEKASAPEQRSFYARCTLYYGIASGDLQVYQDVLQWTKRFLRDPQVMPTLYPRHSQPREVITLLSGIPQNRPDLTSVKVRARVCAANVILQSMFDTACSAIREPSFQVSHWEGTLGLFSQVIQERINESKTLREDLSASDAEMYDALWADTLEMLLAVEKKANHSQNQRLEANIICGPLAWRGWGHNVRFDFGHAKKEKSLYRFFNDLGTARDKYWQELRSTVHPAVLTLPEPLPRGLPIQFLTASWVLDAPDLDQVAPYIASRAKAIVFQDPAAALRPITDNEELIEAIGLLVDSYQYALRLYIPQSCDKDERTKRIKAVWIHAIGPMSHGRMNEDEAVRWWKTKAPNHLKDYWPPNVESDTEQLKWPLIPEVDDPTQPTEWNPFSSAPPNYAKRDLGRLTYLDLTVAVLGRVPTIAQIWTRSKLPNCIPTVPGDEVNTNQIWNSRRDMGEGGVLSALLYLEMKYGAPAGRLLQKPFPSTDDARYPSLYLDDGFQGDSLKPGNAVQHICDYINNIPSALVHLSAKNMMEKLWALDRGEHDDHSVQELAFTLLIRLAESDRPALAQDMALHMILDRPEASSWHRQLLKLSYLRRMSSSDARAYIERFADAITERMLAARDKQDAIELSDAMIVDAMTDEDQRLKKEPFVKVTTIKSLAQLLRDAECVDENFTLTVLYKLIVRATHRDVRLHATKTLLSMYSTCSLETADEILAVLGTLIPLAGNLNESKPVTENDWQIAEETLKLPEYPGIDDELVLSKLIVEQYGDPAFEGEKLRMFIDRILLPTLQYRQRQIARWLALFLRKYKVHDLNVHIPLIPQYTTTLLSSDGVCYLPKSILADLVSYIEFKNTPPEPIGVLQARLRNDPGMLLRPDVQTWFSFFPFGADSVHVFGTFDHLELLDKPSELKDNAGITAADVQDAFLRVFKVAIRADTSRYDRLSAGLLSRLLKGVYLLKSWWSTTGRKIGLEMVAHVESMRTDEWKNSSDRKPVVLPDVFLWQLLLLDFPLPNAENENDASANEEKCKLFANQIITILNEISTSLYHNKLQQVKSYVALNPLGSIATMQAQKQIGGRTVWYKKRNPQHEQLVHIRLITAIHLGNCSAFDGSIACNLRVEVASHLLGLVQSEWKDIIDQELRDRARELVKNWRNSGNEEIRRIGWGFEWLLGGDQRGAGVMREIEESDESDDEPSDSSMSVDSYIELMTF